MKTNTFKCFGSKRNTGNLATIISGAENLSVAERLQLTQEKQYHASVFLNPINDTVISLDFYYPHMRSPLCLHATLAVAYQYFNEHTDVSQLTLITPSKQKITATQPDNNIWLQLDPKPFPEVIVDNAIIQLFINNTQTNPIQILSYFINSVGSPKLFVEVENVNILSSLDPNLSLIHEWSQANKISGCYVYAKIDNVNIYGRNFNHVDARLEDGATGVAAAAITHSLQLDLTVHQGEFLNNPCIINTRYSKDCIYISGQVEELI